MVLREIIGVDLNNDGIGDIPYVIDGENIDNYPLIKPLILVYVSTPYGIATGGGLYKAGSIVTISISQPIIDHLNETRMAFRGWFEKDSLISNEQNFSIIINGPRKIVAKWKTEYRVEIHSNWGTAIGSGWYEPGTTVTVSIFPTIVEKNFFTNYVFDRWESNGNIVSTSPLYSFTLNKPVTLVAIWGAKLNVINLGIAIGTLVMIVFTTLIMILYRKHRKKELRKMMKDTDEKIEK